jgi:hypothetical protein
MSLDLREPRQAFLIRWYQLATFAGLTYHFARSDRQGLYELPQIDPAGGGAPMPRGLSREQLLILRRDYGRWTIAQIWRDMTESFELTLSPPFVFSLRKQVTAGTLAQAKVPRLCAEFSRAGLAEKAQLLRTHAGLEVPLVDQLESLQRARQCLTQRGGVVHERDCEKGQDVLELRWTRAVGDGAARTLETCVKRVPVGTAITMSSQELTESFMTFTVALAQFYSRCKQHWGEDVRVDEGL